MAHNLKINYNRGSFFFGPQEDKTEYTPTEDETYEFSLNLKNLSEDFIRGLYAVMSDIDNGDSFYEVFSLETDLKIKFPMKESIYQSPEGDTYDQSVKYIHDIMIKGKIKQHNAIEAYNSDWKGRCDLHSKILKTNIESKYTARLRSIDEMRLIQFDSLDFLAGIITGISWMEPFYTTMSEMFLIHEDFKLVKVEYDYQIDVSESYREVNEQLWKILDSLRVIKPLFNIVKSYLPNICKGVERQFMEVKDGISTLVPTKPN